MGVSVEKRSSGTFPGFFLFLLKSKQSITSLILRHSSSGRCSAGHDLRIRSVDVMRLRSRLPKNARVDVPFNFFTIASPTSFLITPRSDKSRSYSIASPHQKPHSPTSGTRSSAPYTPHTLSISRCDMSMLKIWVPKSQRTMKGMISRLDSYE